MVALAVGADDVDGYGGPSDGEPEDDIARFERQCAERARAEGRLPHAGEGEDEEGLASDDEDGEAANEVRLSLKPAGARGGGEEALRHKCELLQGKLSRRDGELQQARSDLELLRNESSLPGDPSSELKSRLIDLTKRNRNLQVKVESQKTRVQQLEVEAKKPREEARRAAEELAMQNNAMALGGDGFEDWKKKYLAASNKLQEVRLEVQELRVQAQRQRKVLLKELGTEDAIEKALAVADDPNAGQWRGRAVQVKDLQRQVRELKDQLNRRSGTEDAEGNEGEGQQLQQQQRVQQVVPQGRANKEQNPLSQAAEKRREEFERLQEEAERLRGEQAEFKRKRDAIKSRNNHLEGQLRELKASVQDLLRKSENDDALVEALRRQVGRAGGGSVSSSGGGRGAGAGGEPLGAADDRLRQANAELREQIERQAQIVLQLRQKSLAATCESGSVRLGPDSAVESNQLLERVRFLEADNAKQLEQVRLLRGQLGEDMEASGRPFSAGSTLNLREKLRLMGERLKQAEQENLELRRRAAPAWKEEEAGSV
jgi:hypothetical protein